MAIQELNLFGVVCPINFVRAKIMLDSMQSGEELLIYLDEGEPIESVSKSLLEEGHKIIFKKKHESGWKLLVKRA